MKIKVTFEEQDIDYKEISDNWDTMSQEAKRVFLAHYFKDWL